MGDPRPRRGRSARRRARCLALAAVLAAGLVAGCGGGEEEPREDAEPRADVVLEGETETGMRLEAEPVVDPADDPLLAELDAYRDALGAPPVFYTRVTADNTENDVADEGRVLVVAPDPDTLLQEGGIQLRFTCDALEYEWIPPRGDRELRSAYDELVEKLCADGPPHPDGIEPGERQQYYLFIEQGLESQDLAQQRFFGPRNIELVPPDGSA